MTARLLIILLAFCPTVYSQTTKATDNLILPVNPPRDASPTDGSQLREQVERELKLKEARSQLHSALESGLAKNHPQVRSFEGIIAALEAEQKAPTSPKVDPDPSERLRIAMEVLVDKTQKDHKAMLQQIEDLKSEVAELRAELATLKENKE